MAKFDDSTITRLDRAEDIYFEENLDGWVDDDSLSNWECAFMKGFLSS